MFVMVLPFFYTNILTAGDIQAKIEKGDKMNQFKNKLSV